MPDMAALEGMPLAEVPPSVLAFPVADSKSIDTARCMATAVICTDAVDTQGDIVDPAGALLEIHRANPAVLYHHGIGINPAASGHILPIGKAEDPNGAYTVRMAGPLLMADTYFSQSDPFAMQVFGLYAEKILRGWSVNALPIPGAWDRIDDREGPGGVRKKCYRYKQWALKEYSATALPVNFEALTIAVQKAGNGLHPVLKASLGPLCLKGAAYSPGVVLPGKTSAVAGPTMGKATSGGPTVGVLKAKNTGLLTDRGKDTRNGAIGGAAAGLAVGALLGDTVSGETPESERTEDETDPKSKPAPEGESQEDEPKEDEKKAEDLKPGERGMIDAHQMVRDHRLENAQRHHLTDDPDAMSAHEAIDDHLSKAEEIAADYMEAKGHKRPEAVDFEEVKGMCKAGGVGVPGLDTALDVQDRLEPLGPQKKIREGIATEKTKALTVEYPGIAYHGPRFVSVLKAAAAEAKPTLTPAEARIVARELARLKTRLGI